jgi:AbrB family looped-hinge helix DNA binding protein
MQKLVKVTRKGQTTIPAEIREKLGIREGDELAVEATEQGMVFKVLPRIEGHADPAELKKELDKLREEY